MKREDKYFVLFCLFIVLTFASMMVSDFYLCYKEYIDATPRYIIHTDIGNFEAISYDVGGGNVLYFTTPDKSIYMTSVYFIEAIPGTKPHRDNNYNPESFEKLYRFLNKK